MGRSKTRRRQQKAARRNSSNGTLPTFGQTPLTSYIDQMISPVFSPEISSYSAPRLGVLPGPAPVSTPHIPLKNAWGPGGTPSITSREVGRATGDTVTAHAAAPVDICTSRAIRSEVIHATGNSGRRGQKRPRWTEKSKVKC